MLTKKSTSFSLSLTSQSWKESSTSNVWYWHFSFLSVPDHLCFRFGVNTELHRPRPLVCNLPPADVQEHSQAGPQEYRYNLGRVLCHNDPSSCGDGEQQPATWANQQDQPVYSVRWTLGRFVSTDLPHVHQNIDSVLRGLVFFCVRSFRFPFGRC